MRPEGDHRTRVTRMLIRRAFMELLKKKPIQSISIKELCETAGINRGTSTPTTRIFTTSSARWRRR